MLLEFHVLHLTLPPEAFLLLGSHPILGGALSAPSEREVELGPKQGHGLWREIS